MCRRNRKGVHTVKTKLDKVSIYEAKKKSGKLIKLSKDSDVAVRAAAYRAMGSIGDQASLEECQNNVRDDSPEVRLAIAEAFQKMGDDHVAEALRHQMLEETDPKLKSAFEKAVEFNRGRRGGL